jgi:hypothetical protein|tara:strand:+ start:16449 stop:16592 length:144 start_codon:yes stop_codon:yes gene_type:complete
MMLDMPSRYKKTASKYKNKLGNKTPDMTKDSKNPSAVRIKGAINGFS